MTDVPEIGVGAVYGHGWRQLRKHFGILLGVTIVMFLLGALPGVTQETGTKSYGLLAAAYQVLFIGPVTYGGYYVFLTAARDEAPSFADLFAGFRNYGNVVLASFVVSLIIGIGVLFLVVPGIIFACKLVFVPYLVMDRKLRAFDAMNESWRITDGYAWTVFFAIVAAIPIVIAGVILLGVGVILSVIWIGLAFSALYLAVSERNADQAVASVP